LLLLAKLAGVCTVYAATVDHGLRAESAQEARFCAQLCQQLRVPHRILNVDVASGNLQSQARAARYRALGEVMGEIGADQVLTAHHADDQVETLVMRLNRASGLGGLAGIQRLGPMPEGCGMVFRPLLLWRKTELEQIVRDAGIQPMRDPSNEDDRFDRARVRKALSDADWMDASKLAQSVSHLQDADAALDEWARREWAEHVSIGESDITYRPHLSDPTELMARVVELALVRLTGRSNRSGAMQLIAALKGGQTSNVGGVLAQSCDHEVSADAARRLEWVLRREPPRSRS